MTITFQTILAADGRYVRGVFELARKAYVTSCAGGYGWQGSECRADGQEIPHSNRTQRWRRAGDRTLGATFFIVAKIDWLAMRNLVIIVRFQ